MKEDPNGAADIPGKFYFRIGEVSEITGIAPYVLRFWETEFKQLNPKRTDAGQRLYRRQDVMLVLTIKNLLYQKKFTIAGARQHLRKQRTAPPPPASIAVFPDVAEIRMELIRIRDLIDALRR